MVRFRLGVEDLADTRFAVSPMCETACSLWALADPARYPLHRPWLRTTDGVRATADGRLLLALVGPSFALPDFLTPRAQRFAPSFADELALVRATDPAIVRRDLVATHAPEPLPAEVSAAESDDDAAVVELLDAICRALSRHRDRALAPLWPRMRALLEADTTYRARRLAVGGARLLFADLHPNVRWQDGVVHVSDMIGRHHVDVAGRGLLLIPSVFAYKPVPPLIPDEPPWLLYPARGLATLWERDATVTVAALENLLGRPRARLLGLLADPLPTVELARRLAVTPSAVSQHLPTLHATGLVTRARAGRQVLYQRTPLADSLMGITGHEADGDGRGLCARRGSRTRL
jgi:DNA-binding transcriptional ArsR family regulator